MFARSREEDAMNLEQHLLVTRDRLVAPGADVYGVLRRRGHVVSPRMWEGWHGRRRSRVRRCPSGARDA